MTLTLEQLSTDEFQGTIKSLPVAQLLNEKKAADCGMFVKFSEILKAGWKVTPTVYHTHTFSGGAEEKGLLFHKANMLIINKSPRFVETRAKNEEGRFDIIGVYDDPVIQAQYNADKSSYTLRTIYLIFLLDDAGELLHEVPIALTVKGVAAVAMGQKTEAFRTHLEKAYASAINGTYTVKNDKFHALGVFSPVFKPSHEGTKEKSWVCMATEYKAPSTEELPNFLKLSLSDYIWSIRNSTTDFCDRYFKKEAAFFSVAPEVLALKSASPDFDSTED
jgi:hypothetical protein